MKKIVWLKMTATDRKSRARDVAASKHYCASSISFSLQDQNLSLKQWLAKWVLKEYKK